MSTSSADAARDLQELERLMDDLFKMEGDENSEQIYATGIIFEEFNGLLTLYEEIKISNNELQKAQLSSSGAAESAGAGEGDSVFNSKCDELPVRDVPEADKKKFSLFNALLELAKNNPTIDLLEENEIETLEILYTSMEEDLRKRLTEIYCKPSEGQEENTDEASNEEGAENDGSGDAPDQALSEYDNDSASEEEDAALPEDVADVNAATADRGEDQSASINKNTAADKVDDALPEDVVDVKEAGDDSDEATSSDDEVFEDSYDVTDSA